MTGTIAGTACVIAVTITRHRNNNYRNPKRGSLAASPFWLICFVVSEAR
jgi:hypothetical protein